MSAPECSTNHSDESPDTFQCAPDVTVPKKQVHENASINAQHAVNDTQHSLEDTLTTQGNHDLVQTDVFDVHKRPESSHSENVSDVRCEVDVPVTVSDVADAAKVDDLQHGDAKSNVHQVVPDVLPQQSRVDSSNTQGEHDVGDGAHQSKEQISQLTREELDLLEAVQHPQEKVFNADRKELDMSRALSDVVRWTQNGQRKTRSSLSHTPLVGATTSTPNIPAHPVSASTSTPNLTGQSDVSKAVLDLVGATQNLQEDPANIQTINNLINRLKQLLLQERQTYTFKRQNSESRNKLESLHNLIQYLESQLQRLQKAAHRHGLKYYMANISNKVRGHEMGRIGQSMESELQSWLDQQSVREIVNAISKGSHDAQVHAISSFESVLQKGYNSVLQETILSVGLVEKLAALLDPGAASWPVAQEAAFALSMLIDFNKDIFVSLVLMAKTVENILSLLSMEPDEHVVILVSVIKSMLSVGHMFVLDEIDAHGGVSKIVELLDHESEDLQHVVMDCIFELAYYGRIEVVNKMFELEVVKKLAVLQQSKATEGGQENAQREKPAKKEQVNPLDLTTSWMLPMTSTQMEDEGSTAGNPFANAVTKFALHLSIGTSLRRREKRALKQEFLRQIKEVMEDDAEVANITAEVLWAP